MSSTRQKQVQRRHIEAIASIAEHGSVHRAATRLGTSQPALSRLLAEAESMLGTRIFERSARGSVPTARGRVIVNQTRFLLGSIRRLDDVMNTLGSTIRLGCIPRAMHSIMPHLLNRVHADNHPKGHLPAWKLTVVEDSSTQLLTDLESEKLDFAIMRHVAGAAGIGASYATEHLYKEQPFIICGATNTEFPNDTYTLEELAAKDWVLPSPGSTSRAILDRFWQEQDLPTLRSVIETRTFESNLALVVKTAFISIVPESIARHYAQLGMVKIIDTETALPSSSVMLVYNQTIKEDALCQPFRALVQAAAQDTRADL
ncbi:hypothetical protein W822_02620 [Advenella kashmirensis W13003]|uniref:HTH lysR-type domain-containing protein n=1 Tax=Advenella kashmirensis W13003 TaxID=1424334 RepID=V8QZF0_9BURK|nr:LysR family transcriptional regulator [Advenella kashmirensis]ETF04695.1 hypothetical protein W822_02620 [Advenella kashmirensis W13003]